MDAKQYEALVGDAEVRLKRLRALYDQWFAGVERVEPQQSRRDFEVILNQLRREQVRNTALKFRFNQVVQRYTTYTTYWRRITRQIEEGTYKRDVLRARRLAEQMPGSPQSRKDGYDLDIDVDIETVVDGALADAGRSSPPPLSPRPLPISPLAMPDGPPLHSVTSAGEPIRSFPAPALPSPALPSLTAPKPGAPPPPASIGGRRVLPPPPPPPAAGLRPPPTPSAAPRVPPPAGLPRPPAASGAQSGIAEDQMRRIYERYVEARRLNQERTDVKFESVQSSVRNMLPKLQQKHAGKNIDFEIVVKDGKVALKPIAR